MVILAQIKKMINLRPCSVRGDLNEEFPHLKGSRFGHFSPQEESLFSLNRVRFFIFLKISHL